MAKRHQFPPIARIDLGPDGGWTLSLGISRGDGGVVVSEQGVGVEIDNLACEVGGYARSGLCRGGSRSSVLASRGGSQRDVNGGHDPRQSAGGRIDALDGDGHRPVILGQDVRTRSRCIVTVGRGRERKGGGDVIVGSAGVTEVRRDVLTGDVSRVSCSIEGVGARGVAWEMAGDGVRTTFGGLGACEGGPRSKEGYGLVWWERVEGDLVVV